MSTELSPRVFPFSAVVEGEFCVWGGEAVNFSQKKKVLASSLYSYNPDNECWTRRKCSGPPPPGLYAGACAAAGSSVYVYGGKDDSYSRSCSLHELDTKTLTWRLLSSAGPSRKRACDNMVTYKNKLILFGGFGDPLASTQPAQWHGKFTNELHTFDVEEGESVRLKCPCWGLMSVCVMLCEGGGDVAPSLHWPI